MPPFFTGERLPLESGINIWPAAEVAPVFLHYTAQ